jgi:hypothetical protein
MLPPGYNLDLANFLAALGRTSALPLNSSLGALSNGLARGRSTAIVHEDGQVVTGTLSPTNGLDNFGVQIDRRPELIDLLVSTSRSMHQVVNLILEGVVLPDQLQEHAVLALLVRGDDELYDRLLARTLKTGQ